MHNQRCSLMTLLVLVLCPVANATADWKAGVAKQLITPTQPTWMSGYASRNHASEGTLACLDTEDHESN